MEQEHILIKKVELGEGQTGVEAFVAGDEDTLIKMIFSVMLNNNFFASAITKACQCHQNYVEAQQASLN